MGSSLPRPTPTGLSSLSLPLPHSTHDIVTMKYLICLALFASAAFALDYQEDDMAMETARNDDRSFFFRFLDELLFDEDYSQAGAERRMFRDSGLLGMPMPADLRDEDSFTGRMYADFKEMFYSNACRFGLNNLLKTVSGMFGIA